ncbi:MAG: iron-containing alcohol dehydrogenase [Clostridiales bacterium]|jgi:glycerol-1-phosphate dehydrogenase [NAD(P)+]|nr:iron-containing alcohol dehydrogenase [Clostridiales bacterium]
MNEGFSAKFCGLDACDCGKRHEQLTGSVEVADGAFGQLHTHIAAFLPEGGKVLYIYDGAVGAAQTVKRLLTKKYRAAEFCRDNMVSDRKLIGEIRVEEDVRLVVCAGGGSVADVAKYAAARLGLPLVMCGTSQATAGYLTASAMLYADGFCEVYKTAPPAVFLLDTAELSDDGTLNAAGFGEVCSRLTALFDWEFAAQARGESYCKSVEKEALLLICDLIKRVENAPAAARPALIAKSAVRLSLLMQRMGDSRLMCGGDMQIMHALSMLFRREARAFKLWGENEMLVSQVAIRAYLALLESGDMGFQPPPDNNLRLEAMGEYLGIGPGRAFKKIQPYISYDELLTISHCVAECREELLFKLRIYQKILLNANRIFKRLYKDKGYSYNEYVGAADLSLCIGLAPDVREKFTTLTYMKQLGLLDRYIA